MKITEKPALYRVEEAGDYLGIGRATIYRLIASGQLKTVKIGAARRIPVEALDAFIARLGTESAGAA